MNKKITKIAVHNHARDNFPFGWVPLNISTVLVYRSYGQIAPRQYVVRVGSPSYIRVNKILD